MSTARGGIQWTVEEYVFGSLEGLTTVASYLFLGVLQEEVLCVLSGERVSCNKPEECGVG